MRGLAVVLTIALLAMAVPTAQAYTCTGQQIVPIDGLDEAAVRLCDTDGDGTPDDYQLLVHETGSQASGSAGQEDWGNDQRLIVDSAVTSGYPLAPTGEVRASAIDERSDGTQDRIYLQATWKTALGPDPAPGVFIGLEDNNDDDRYETAYVLVCTRTAGCHFASNPTSLIGTLIGAVPPWLIGQIPAIGVPTPGDLLPGNVP